MGKMDVEQFFTERGFGKTLGIGKKPCIVIVDLILGFTTPNMVLGSDLTNELKNTNEIIKVARKYDIPIIFTTIAYDHDSLSDCGIWVKKMEGLKTLRAGTEAVKIDPTLDFQDTDDLIVKKYASAFFGTDLVSRLTTKGVDTVIVTGCTTSGCVRATVVDAMQYGFRPIVVEDAVGDRSPETHQQSLFDMRQKYSDVIPTFEVIEDLNNYAKRLDKKSLMSIACKSENKEGVI